MFTFIAVIIIPTYRNCQVIPFSLFLIIEIKPKTILTHFKIRIIIVSTLTFYFAIKVNVFTTYEKEVTLC